MSHRLLTIAVALAIAITGVALVGSGVTPDPQSSSIAHPSVFDAPGSEELTEVIQQYCTRCHNPRRLAGNLSLEEYAVEAAAGDAETSERIIKKLRAGMMPPAGARRPAGDTLLSLVETIEESVVTQGAGP